MSVQNQLILMTMIMDAKNRGCQLILQGKPRYCLRFRTQSYMKLKIIHRIKPPMKILKVFNC